MEQIRENCIKKKQGATAFGSDEVMGALSPPAILWDVTLRIVFCNFLERKKKLGNRKGLAHGLGTVVKSQCAIRRHF